MLWYSVPFSLILFSLYASFWLISIAISLNSLIFSSVTCNLLLILSFVFHLRYCIFKLWRFLLNLLKVFQFFPLCLYVFLYCLKYTGDTDDGSSNNIHLLHRFCGVVLLIDFFSWLFISFPSSLYTKTISLDACHCEFYLFGC